jgi:hypothetical protein
MKNRRNLAYLLGFIIFFTIWGTAYWLLKQSEPSVGETTETIIQDSQVFSAAEIGIFGDLSQLEGQLFFIEQREQPSYRIAQLNVEQRRAETVFSIPLGALVSQMTAARDNQTLLLSYFPPDNAQRGIYELRLTDANLRLLHSPLQDEVNYFYPQATRDYLYYIVFEGDLPQHPLERLELVTGETLAIADNVSQIAVSSEHIAYIAIELEESTSSLWIANLDGSDAHVLATPQENEELDLPQFSQDGLSIYYAVLQKPQEASLFDIFVGAFPVQAHGDHNLPAIWRRIEIATGAVQDITHNPELLWAGVSFGEEFAYATESGITLLGEGIIVTSPLIRHLAWLPSQ